MKNQKAEKPISDEAINKRLEQGRTAEDMSALLKQLTRRCWNEPSKPR